MSNLGSISSPDDQLNSGQEHQTMIGLPDDCIVEIGLQLGEYCDLLAFALTCKSIYKILSERIAVNRFKNRNLSICNIYNYENSYIVFCCRGERAIGTQIILKDKEDTYKRKCFNRTVIDRYISIFKESNTRLYYATNIWGAKKWENLPINGSIYLELNVDWATDKITYIYITTKNQTLSYDHMIYTDLPEKFNSAPFREAYEYFYKGTLCDKFFGEYFIRAVEIMETRHRGWNINNFTPK